MNEEEQQPEPNGDEPTREEDDPGLDGGLPNGDKPGIGVG